MALYISFVAPYLIDWQCKRQKLSLFLLFFIMVGINLITMYINIRWFSSVCREPREMFRSTSCRQRQEILKWISRFGFCCIRKNHKYSFFFLKFLCFLLMFSSCKYLSVYSWPSSLPAHIVRVYTLFPLQNSDKKFASGSWQRIMNACSVLGITNDEIKTLWSVVAAVIHLGAAGVVKGQLASPHSPVDLLTLQIYLSIPPMKV